MNLAECKLEAIMQHLRECPKDLSPNKDFMLGIIYGMDALNSSLDDSARELLEEQAIEDLMQGMSQYEEEELGEADFVRS